MIHHSEDKLFKLINEKWAKEFGELINISLKNYKPIPTELIEETGCTKYIDAGWESENKIITMEFQSKTPNIDDQMRFVQYASTLVRKLKKPVQVNAICTPELKNPEKLENIKTKYFEIRYIHFKHIDGDKKLNNIKNKIKNNEKLNENDLLDLTLIPLMGTKYDTATQLEKVIDLSNEKTIPNKEELEKIKSMQMLLVDKFIKDEIKLKELVEKIKMSTDAWKLYNQGLREEGKIEGKIEGSEETKLEIARTLLLKNLPIEEIIEITKLTKDKINSLK